MKAKFSIRRTRTDYKDMIKLSIDNNPTFLSLEVVGLHKPSEAVDVEIKNNFYLK